MSDILRVKVFEAEYGEDLEEEMNAFLETVSEAQVKDVKFQAAGAEDSEGIGAVCCFSAMVLYRE